MATIPTAYTWVVGELMTAAKMNAYLRDLATFVLGRPYAQLTHNTTQSVNNLTDAFVSFNTEAADTDAGHSTTTNTSRYTCQTAGVWHLDACIPWASSATGRRWVWFRVNNTTDHHSNLLDCGNSTSHTNALSGRILLQVGDYVEVYVNQSSGGALNISNTTKGGQRFDLIWDRT